MTERMMHVSTCTFFSEFFEIVIPRVFPCSSFHCLMNLVFSPPPCLQQLFSRSSEIHIARLTVSQFSFTWPICSSCLIWNFIFFEAGFLFCFFSAWLPARNTWLFSYLSPLLRISCGSSSPSQSLNMGVPKSSVLGPLLYLLFKWSHPVACL